MEFGGSSAASLERRSKYSRAVMPGVTVLVSQHVAGGSRGGRTFTSLQEMWVCLMQRLSKSELRRRNAQAPPTDPTSWPYIHGRPQQSQTTTHNNTNMKVCVLDESPTRGRGITFRWKTR
jgi:hypothetical protein